MQNRRSDDAIEGDPLGLNLLTAVELSDELVARGMRKGGNKAVLIARLSESMQSDNGEPEIHQGAVGVIDENDEEGEIEGMEEYNT